MDDHPHRQQADFDQLNQRITALENKLARLEKEIVQSRSGKMIQRVRRETPEIESEPQAAKVQKESLESKMGEYGMAWLGNIVLLFGILFLTQLLQKNDQKVFALLLGLVSVAGIYLAGSFTQKSFPYMSRLFKFNGHILLYITSMQIYILQGTRIIESAVVGHGIVLLVIAAFIYMAFRSKSQVMVVIVWMMAVVTAIASNSTHLMLSILVGITGTSIYFALKNNWWIGLIISLVLVYIAFLMWIMGNPIASGSFEIVANHQYGYVYLFTCALSYSLLAMIQKTDRIREQFLNATIILNGLGFSLILTLAVLSFFADNYFVYFGLIAAFCMGYSIFLQSRGTWKSIASLYAIYSFVALSITIGGIYKFPLAFFLLSIQSLLVVSMALWFRSRFIVIMNTLLYLGLLITYMATADSLTSINFSFALVALITARVLNWKKKRLEIRTELIRNIYLFIGFVMILISLQKAVPAQFVTLSWALSAMVFFILSVVIKNVKYRWLAIFTMVVTVFYLFIVDLQNISLGYRIVALLFISIISLGISIFYTRRLKSKEEDQEHQSDSSG